MVCGAGEHLPFPCDYFDLILSHEVLEHVQDDRAAICEMVRVLRSGGRLALFCPNRGYPFETHGIYWRGRYHFGNIPLVNWLPRRWRDRLAPHVHVYTRRDLETLFAGLPVRLRSAHRDLWGIRQHHCPPAGAGKIDAHRFANIRKNSLTAVRIIAFLGG